jgi:hypothetical protein
MKYSCIIAGCLLLCGCYESQYYKNLKIERDKVTISQSYYLTTILHNDHLFIMSNTGYFIHHPDCECSKIKVVEKDETPPVIIEFGKKDNNVLFK